MRGVPPGRAGQVWLQHRLGVAERGADLLEQKLRILHRESVRQRSRCERTRAALTAMCAEAETWLARAVLVAGEQGVRLAGAEAEAEVRIGWTHTMGATYPASGEVVVPPRSSHALPVASAALDAARAAYRTVADAAVELAVAEAALRVVEAEEAVTRRRLRALTTRWIPRLTSVLDATRLSLEEQEHEDAVRRRWAEAERPSRGHGARPARRLSSP